MAHWESRRSWTYRVDNIEYPRGTYSKYTWEYSTGSDYLAIRVTHPAGTTDAYTGSKVLLVSETRQLIGNDEAYQLYLCLRNWIGTYRGKGTLERLDTEKEVDHALPEGK